VEIARLALELLVWPLAEVTEPAKQRDLAGQLLAARWKALTIPTAEVAALQERMRRERAKLLRSLEAEPEGAPVAADSIPAAPPTAPKPAHHSDDFRSVRWYGADYRFTPTQAACVRVLWEAWERGHPEVGQETILSAAESDGSRLRDLFKRPGSTHPAWGEMIVEGGTKGAYRLAEPEEFRAPR
jgi:hypothetical protein